MSIYTSFMVYVFLSSYHLIPVISILCLCKLGQARSQVEVHEWTHTRSILLHVSSKRATRRSSHHKASLTTAAIKRWQIHPAIPLVGCLDLELECPECLQSSTKMMSILLIAAHLIISYFVISCLRKKNKRFIERSHLG